MEKTILISVMIGMIVFLGLHLVFWRRSASNSPRMILLAALAGIGLGATALAQIFFNGLKPVPLFTALWIDTFLLISYFFVYAGVCRSVSVTLMSRLMRSKDQTVDFGILVDEYIRSTRFEDRIRLMDQSGWVQLSGNSVRITPKGLAVARVVRFLSRATGREMEG